ncbi:MAG TPA: hypothetical protein VMR43_00950, partial [Variovorax sp.]|nr:hypothetical protein [Variovorax sp.]
MITRSSEGEARRLDIVASSKPASMESPTANEVAHGNVSSQNQMAETMFTPVENAVAPQAAGNVPGQESKAKNKHVRFDETIREEPATPPMQSTHTGLRSNLFSMRSVFQNFRPRAVESGNASHQSLVHWNDRRVDDRAEKKNMTLQLRRNKVLDREREQTLSEFTIHQNRVKEAQAASSDRTTGIGSASNLSLKERFPVPEFPSPPGHLKSTLLQKIDSFDATPPPPAPGSSQPHHLLASAGVLAQDVHFAIPKPTQDMLPGRAPMSNATSENLVEPRLSSVASTEIPSSDTADVSPMQGVQLQPSAKTPDASMDPMLRYIDEMSTSQQSALLLDPSNFRQGYYAGLAQVSGYRIPQALTAGDMSAAQGFTNAQAFFNTLHSQQSTPATQGSEQPGIPPAFRHGHAYGLTAGGLHMPTADRAPTLSEIALIASANQNTAISQPQHAESGSLSSTGANMGTVPAVLSFPNPIVVLQAPPIDVPIVHTGNPPEAQGNQTPGLNTQIQDSRFP